MFIILKYKMNSINEVEGSLDDFINNLVRSQPKDANSIQLEIHNDDYENAFKVLVEIFTKSMKYIYGNARGIVDLDSLGVSDMDLMSKYFNSFGYKLFIEKVEGTSNKTSYGAFEDKPVKEGELKAQCLKIQTKNNLYVIYFDNLLPN